jgi:hypothetical protein
VNVLEFTNRLLGAHHSWNTAWHELVDSSGLRHAVVCRATRICVVPIAHVKICGVVIGVPSTLMIPRLVEFDVTVISSVLA